MSCASAIRPLRFLWVEGESMTGAGIFPDDILVVDRSLNARHGDIVIASLEREMTVKQLHPSLNLCRCWPAIRVCIRRLWITEGMVLEIFGVVTSVVRS